MEGFYVWLIIITICLIGWMPISELMEGITNIIKAIKDKDNNKKG